MNIDNLFEKDIYKKDIKDWYKSIYIEDDFGIPCTMEIRKSIRLLPRVFIVITDSEGHEITPENYEEYLKKLESHDDKKYDSFDNPYDFDDNDYYDTDDDNYVDSLSFSLNFTLFTSVDLLEIGYILGDPKLAISIVKKLTNMFINIAHIESYADEFYEYIIKTSSLQTDFSSKIDFPKLFEGIDNYKYIVLRNCCLYEKDIKKFLRYFYTFLIELTSIQSASIVSEAYKKLNKKYNKDVREDLYFCHELYKNHYVMRLEHTSNSSKKKKGDSKNGKKRRE